MKPKILILFLSVVFILSLDFNVQAQNLNERLISAIKANNYDSVQILISNGADVNFKDNKGLTPLMYAVENDTNGRIVNFLLENGADVSAKDNENKTVFEYASKNPNPKIKENLINYSRDEKIYSASEVMKLPEFPGGEYALLNYIATHIKYPKKAQKKGIEGTVYIKFEITKTGEIGKIEVIRGVHPLLDNEAVRVIKSLPKFKPGIKDGRPVNVWFSIPIQFRLH